MNLHLDQVGDVAIVECQGRIFPDADAFRLRDAVLSQAAASTIVLDLSQVYAVGDNILFMLLRLQRWAVEHRVELHLFNPSSFVCQTLQDTGFASEFQVDNSLDQIISMLSRAASPASRAA